MVRVSEIEMLRGRRVKITLDNGDTYLLLKSIWQDRPLEINQAVDAAEYAEWVLQRQYRSALDKAVAMLAQRPCSRGEIEKKLKTVGYSVDTVEMVLFKLDSNGLLNDAEFADQWARYRAGQKLGPRRIARELRYQKGLSPEDTENAILALPEEDQLEAAVSLARKAMNRVKPGEDIRKTRQRILSALVRRGYDWDMARQAVDQVLGNEEEW